MASYIYTNTVQWRIQNFPWAGAAVPEGAVLLEGALYLLKMSRSCAETAPFRARRAPFLAEGALYLLTGRIHERKGRLFWREY